MKRNNILIKLLSIGIVASSISLNSCRSTECEPQPADEYIIYINQTGVTICIKGYFSNKENKNVINEEYSIQPLDSLSFKYSNSLRGNDSVTIIFNNQKELRYHSRATANEKYSIYDPDEYQRFKINADNYFILKEIYTFSEKHLKIAEEIKLEQ